MCKLWRYAERSCGNCNDLLEPITTLKEEFAFAENRTSKLQRSVSHSLALLLVGTLLTGQVQLVYMLIYSRTFKAFSMLYEPILLQNSVMHFLFTLQCSYPSFFLSSPVDSLSLSHGGQFMIPSSTSVELLVDFLCKHKHKAVELQEENKRLAKLIILYLIQTFNFNKNQLDGLI